MGEEEIGAEVGSIARRVALAALGVIGLGVALVALLAPFVW